MFGIIYRFLVLFGQEDLIVKREYFVCFQNGGELFWFKQLDFSKSYIFDFDCFIWLEFGWYFEQGRLIVVDGLTFGWLEYDYFWRCIKYRFLRFIFINVDLLDFGLVIEYLYFLCFFGGVDGQLGLRIIVLELRY